MKEYLEENLKNIDFYGFKVLQLKKDPDSAWYKAYKAVATAFSELISDASEQGQLAWKGSNADAEGVFNSTLGQSEKAFRGAGASAPVEEVKKQSIDLLADIKSGKTVN